MNDLAPRAISIVGFAVLLGIAWLCSNARSQINRRTIGWGLALQVGLAGFCLWQPVRAALFPALEIPVQALIAWTGAGAAFLFGPLVETGPSFALGVFPVLIFMGSLLNVLYHLQIVQLLVRFLGRRLSNTMGISGAEGLAAVANVLVGMIESGLVIRPYVAKMTESELFSFMVVGMSTIAGTVLVAYITLLGGGDFAGHLVVASIVSAPAALVVSKIMIPETGTPETLGKEAELENVRSLNVIDAAAEGGITAMKLALNIGALLLAFVALIAMVNTFVGLIGGVFGAPELTLQAILGVLLAPLAFLMGVPWAEAQSVGSLIGLKTIINEFVAYQGLGQALADGTLSERSGVIAAYALCGFANFGSLAILLGGIEAIAPGRRADAARLGLRSILGGTLATCMTGCLAGLIV